ncbi:MAG: hypothetical protein ABIY70_06835 [Capsulimonas sp.]|uniref:DUF7336 domain-containing protein n=1 Tax=Capsulimonas sp. TaxID=2494211 RepID=UPI00326348C8
MKLFLLYHVQDLGYDYIEHITLVGVYSSEAQAEQARERVKLQPGFCEAPEAFEINPYEVDQDHWREGYFTDTYPLPARPRRYKRRRKAPLIN